MNENTYAIYQVKEGMDSRAVRFIPLEQLRAAGLSVDWVNYNHMYTGALEKGEIPTTATLEALFERFNIARPADFT